MNTEGGGIYTANISKFSNSENALKNLENMCNYASIFWSWKWRKNMRFCSEIFSSKNLEKSTGFLTLRTSRNFLLQKMLQKILKICVIMPAFFDPKNGGKI